MRYNNLGRSGLLVSEVSFGSWLTFANQLEQVQQGYELMKAAYESGINFFDNAEVCIAILVQFLAVGPSCFKSDDA